MVRRYYPDLALNRLLRQIYNRARAHDRHHRYGRENQFPYINPPYATVTINHAVPVRIYISRYQFLSCDVINRRRNNRCVCE